MQFSKQVILFSSDYHLYLELSFLALEMYLPMVGIDLLIF